MKEIINYYYNFDIVYVIQNKNYTSFIYNGEDFYFVFFNRSEEELKDIINIITELKYKSFFAHDIIVNRNGSVLTKVGDNYYVLLKVIGNKNQIISFDDVVNNFWKLKLNNKNSRLYRNNWGELWSKKIDYFEYQMNEIGKDKKIIIDSFSYYVGLSENAISYVNKINSVIKIDDSDKIVLSHRRIFYPNTYLNYYNPLSFIFDLEVRDVAEYLKSMFFKKDIEYCLDELKSYLSIRKLNIYEYHMFYARLLYPSYYFDVYDSVMNKNANEEELVKIVKRSNDYEKFLKKTYLEISKYVKLDKIDWIIEGH